MIIASNENNNEIKNEENKIHKNVLCSRLYNSYLSLLKNVSDKTASMDVDMDFIFDPNHSVNNRALINRHLSNSGKDYLVDISLTRILNDAFKAKRKVVHKYTDDFIDRMKLLGFDFVYFSGSPKHKVDLCFIHSKHKIKLLVEVIGMTDTSLYSVDEDDIFESYSDEEGATLSDPYISNVKMTFSFNIQSQDIIDVYNKTIAYFSNNNVSYYDIVNQNEYVNLIKQSQSGYDLAQIKLDYEGDIFEELDTHYGNGFSDKYEELVANISSSKKGLVLFHGVPGSGKSYCIKHMIKRFNNKCVIFVQPNMINNLTDPAFVGYLTELLNEHKDTKENILLIVEEAESLLMSRDSGNHNSGISNLLNSTDGILNNALKIQMILTFNTDTFDMDKAIMREGRLLGDFKFGYLSKSNIKSLCDRLKLDENLFVDTDQLTLADIYSKSNKHSSVIFSSDDSSNNNVGFVV